VASITHAGPLGGVLWGGGPPQGLAIGRDTGAGRDEGEDRAKDEEEGEGGWFCQLTGSKEGFSGGIGLGILVIVLYSIILLVLLLQLKRNYDDAAKRDFTIIYIGVSALVLPFLMAQLWVLGEWPLILVTLMAAIVGYFTNVNNTRY